MTEPIYPALCHLWADWHQADRAAWERAIAPRRYAFAKSGPLHHLAERSVKSYAYEISRSRRWRISQGASPSDASALIWSQQELEAYVAHLERLDQAPATLAVRLSALSAAVLAGRPDQDRSFLRRKIIEAVRLANASRTSDPIVDTMALLECGDQLIEASRSLATPYWADLAFRTGLQMLLMALRPYRIAHFASIKVGDEEPPAGHRNAYLIRQAGCWWICYKGPRESRKAKPADLPIPATIAPLLDEYLAPEGCRARLCARTGYAGRALWVSTRGGALGNNALYKQITKKTKSLLGQAVSPHQFRHALATSMANGEPAEASAAHEILGNSVAVVARRYERSPRTLAASERAIDVIQRLIARESSTNAE